MQNVSMTPKCNFEFNFKSLLMHFALLNFCCQNFALFGTRFLLMTNCFHFNPSLSPACMIFVTPNAGTSVSWFSRCTNVLSRQLAASANHHSTNGTGLHLHQSHQPNNHSGVLSGPKIQKLKVSHN